MLPYISRDVATEPPTTIVIVESGKPLPSLNIKGEVVFAISEDCVEPTEGWLKRGEKPLLTICFMHSFGKCTGRANSDRQTCFQIHIDTQVLNAVRRNYTNPTRRYFTRTVKAQLGPSLHHQLSMKARKQLKVHYLEYGVQEIAPTVGLSLYEAAYREWLFRSDRTTDFFASFSAVQCPKFATTGCCPNGCECPYIHAHLRNAQVRDPVLGRVLQDCYSATPTR